MLMSAVVRRPGFLASVASRSRVGMDSIFRATTLPVGASGPVSLPHRPLGGGVRERPTVLYSSAPITPTPAGAPVLNINREPDTSSPAAAAASAATPALVTGALNSVLPGAGNAAGAAADAIGFDFRKHWKPILAALVALAVLYYLAKRRGSKSE